MYISMGQNSINKPFIVNETQLVFKHYIRTHDSVFFPRLDLVEWLLRRLNFR